MPIVEREFARDAAATDDAALHGGAEALNASVLTRAGQPNTLHELENAQRWADSGRTV